MTTALDLVTRAMKQRRILGNNGTPTGSEGADGLVSLNAMLKTWSGQRAMVYQILQEALTLSAGNASRTIGTSGNFNTTRPTRVMDSTLVLSDITYPVELISIEDYDAISDKTTSGRPEVMAYRPEFPLGILYFYPVPDSTAATASAFKLNSWKQLQQFASLSTDYAMPPEYEEAIVFNLSRRLSHMGGQLSQDDMLIAQESYNTVRNVNGSPRPAINTELGTMGGGFVHDIRSG